jgi:transcriptional regulator with XRE-family HTH domain
MMAAQKITSSIKKLWARFADKEYRDGFVESAIEDSLAVQIFSMRERRGWTQQELAEKCGTQQSGVCRWEGGSPPQSLAPLKKLASAFDVALVVKFVPFSELLRTDGPADKHVASFHEDVVECCASARPSRHVIIVGPDAWHYGVPKAETYAFASLSDMSMASGLTALSKPSESVATQ